MQRSDMTFFCNLLILGLVFLSCCGIGHSQNHILTDSVNSQSGSSFKVNQYIDNNYQKSVKFYIPDSIFSLRSPKGYVPSLIHNFGEQTTSPLHFKTKQWLITGASVGLTATLILSDNFIDKWARTQKQNHNWINKSSPVITQLGSSYSVYSVVAAGVICAAFKNEKGVQTSLLATQAMITSGLWVQLIKQLTSRERPKASYIFSGSEGGKWHGPFAKFIEKSADDRSRLSYDAFPSGHTATAFSIATVFASQYNNTKVVPVISYSLASLVGLSRLTEHEHWSSDVFVGALLGYVCGKQVVAHYNRTQQNTLTSESPKSKIKSELTFIQFGNQVGISLKW
jgi:membrane-associated PAP2 superfamily phosphatase